MSGPLQQLVQELRLIAEAPANNAVQLRQVTVVSVQAGPPQTVTVTLGSAVTIAGVSFADSITTPAANDILWCLQVGTQLVAFMRLHL